MEGFEKIGCIEPKCAADVAFSRLGLGFEKLDRGAFDPEKAYDKVAALGVKWIRIQSGWARTETRKGVYDFAWLDSIVDHLIQRGLRPWICLCYGNGLYDERAAQTFGAVGWPPIYDEESRAAWGAYVRALVSRYKGRVSDYEVWNEPDGKWCWKAGPSGTEYGDLLAMTARAVRSADPAARVLGGSVCMRKLSFIDDALRACGKDLPDAITFHEYTADETQVFERVRSLKALLRRYDPKITVIQGESGSQSRRDGEGALNGGAWTPRRQARQLLRHTVADLLCGVEFTSYFSALDMLEGLNGKVGDKASYQDYGYFGVLGAEFDENGVATGEYQPKPSYYAMQNLASVFEGEWELCDLPLMARVEDSKLTFAQTLKGKELTGGGFLRERRVSLRLLEALRFDDHGIRRRGDAGGFRSAGGFPLDRSDGRQRLRGAGKEHRARGRAELFAARTAGARLPAAADIGQEFLRRKKCVRKSAAAEQPAAER